MNSKDFIQAAKDGKTLRYKSMLPTVSVVKGSTGHFTYMDLEHSVFAPVDEFEAMTENEAQGYIDGLPSILINTENWEVIE